MLYQIGPIQLDTMPFNADALNRAGGADLAVKPLMNALPGREFMGESDEKITISGQLRPIKVGGQTELEMAHALSRGGTALPVLRGDGKMFGWFAIESVSEAHSELHRDGRGDIVKYQLSLVKVEPDVGNAAAPAGGIVGMLLSLFEAL